MNNDFRLGWAPLAELLTRDEPKRPSIRSPEPVRFSADQEKERRKLDAPPMWIGVDPGAGDDMVGYTQFNGVDDTLEQFRERLKATFKRSLSSKFQPGTRVRATNFDAGTVFSVHSFTGRDEVAYVCNFDSGRQQWFMGSSELELIQEPEAIKAPPSEAWTDWIAHREGPCPIPGIAPLGYEISWRSGLTSRYETLWSHQTSGWLSGSIAAYKVRLSDWEAINRGKA